MSREYKETIDLLLTDIVMPGMRGNDLAWEIQKERPGIAVLFISGYADLDKLGANISIVEKPFAFPELGMRVRSSLDQDKKTETDEVLPLQKPAASGVEDNMKIQRPAG